MLARQAHTDAVIALRAVSPALSPLNILSTGKIFVLWRSTCGTSAAAKLTPNSNHLPTARYIAHRFCSPDFVEIHPIKGPNAD
ncbi:MAG TPA: hypothetical protein VIK56_15500 [Rhodoferax sp.]